MIWSQSAPLAMNACYDDDDGDIFRCCLFAIVITIVNLKMLKYYRIAANKAFEFVARIQFSAFPIPNNLVGLRTVAFFALFCGGREKNHRSLCSALQIN